MDDDEYVEEEREKSFAELPVDKKLSAHLYYSREVNKDHWDRYADHPFPPPPPRSTPPFGSSDLIGLNRYSLSELTEIAGGFSEEQRLIQLTEDGKLYRGYIKQESGDMKRVTVKTFEFRMGVNFEFERNVIRFYDEVRLMTGPLFQSSPRVVDVLGVCVEGKLSVVYDVMFHKSLYDVIPSDDFGWDDRIKVASQLADVLAALHKENYILCVFNASAVMVDESYDVKVFDMSRARRLKNIGGKISFNRRTRHIYCYPPEFQLETKFTACTDVYAFGSVLLELFSKETVHHHYEDTKSLLAKRNEETLIDSSLSKMTFVANQVEDLVRKCLDEDPRSRPTMGVVCDAFQEISASSKKQKTG